MPDPAAYWDEVWSSKEPAETSWFQVSPEPCSSLIRARAQPQHHVAIVGAGASHLVVDLLVRGYRRIAAVDISPAALDQLRKELAGVASVDLSSGAVRFRQADVRTVTFDEPVDLWHDRATFHFLTDAADRAAYAAAATRAVRPGGYAIVATFALDGPESCSGLPVARYDAAALAAELGDGFTLVDARKHRHVTPWGTTQPFTYAVLRREPGKSLNN
jgi:SAM-dependent methyltransferase